MGTNIGRKLGQLLVAMMAATLAFATPRADADAFEEAEFTDVRLQIDNDLFAGRELDRDYTGGFAVTISGRAAADGLLSLDRLLIAIDNVTSPAQESDVYHARQLGFMTF